MLIRRDEFDLLQKSQLINKGEYYITCKHKKSKRKKYYIASDTIRFRIVKLMKERQAPKEIVDWFYNRLSPRKKVGA